MKHPILAALFLMTATHAGAEVSVKEPWARATVPQQRASGAFMELTSTADAKLVEARSSVAGIVEIHEMTMDKDIMKMKAIPALDLPAGKPVVLRPGSYHVMLMELKQQLLEGSSVPLTLVIEENGKRKNIEVNAPIRALNFQPKGERKH